MDIFMNAWEQKRGDVTLRNLISDSMISNLTNQGFRIRLELMPIVNNVHESTHKYMLKDSLGHLTNFVDFTQPEACAWYETILRKLYYENELKLFHLFYDRFTNVTMHEKINQNDYFTNWLETVAKVGNVTSYLAYKSQKVPFFAVLIRHVQSDYSQALKLLISNALSISIGGYSFLSSYWGWDSDEMYIRWLQAASLMPMMLFSSMPIANDKITELTKKFINLHKEHSTIIIELAKKRVSNGSPIIRPMWYAAPDDPKTFQIDDQFMLGDDIVVAPVVNVGQIERSVYLPLGNWIDQHGKAYKGPGNFTVNVPLDELAYFKRNVI